jgi:hypothetical protein
MADLVVSDDLANLAGALDVLVGEFKNALGFQNHDKGIWGQLNANLSMGDFADNWTVHREKLVEKMEELGELVAKVHETWGTFDSDLAATLAEDSE